MSFKDFLYENIDELQDNFMYNLPDPDYPSAIYYPSHNVGRCDEGERTIKYIILHATEENETKSFQKLTLSHTKVSAHYLISRDGTVAQLVQEKDIAWHAGKSFWKDDQNLNPTSIGIELVSEDGGHTEPFTEAQ